MNDGRGEFGDPLRTRDLDFREEDGTGGRLLEGIHQVGTSGGIRRDGSVAEIESVEVDTGGQEVGGTSRDLSVADVQDGERLGIWVIGDRRRWGCWTSRFV